MTTNLNQIIERQIAEWRARAKLAQPNKLPVIPSVALSHSHGAGGAEIADEVATRLGFRRYDRELIELIASEAGVVEELVAVMDEKVQSTLDRLLTRVFADKYLDPKDHVRHMVRSVSALAHYGGVVIVGRCAGQFLDRATTVSVHLDAPFNLRMRRIADQDALDDDEARARVLAVDANRAAFARKHFLVEWGDPLQHYMVLNTARIGFAEAAETIVGLVKARYPRVDVPLPPI